MKCPCRVHNTPGLATIGQVGNICPCHVRSAPGSRIIHPPQRRLFRVTCKEAMLTQPTRLDDLSPCRFGTK